MTADAYAPALLALTFGIAIGWCWGHATARIRHVPVGATEDQDDAVLWAHDRARAEDLLAQLGHPDVDSDDAESPFGWRDLPKPNHTVQNKE
ncbi:hypothetical protein A4E84_20335 [Streptomyces qaidamensis]|uniref:Uncharacterized protein n=1 Tax=Streptomyces qaidamensis TaxID=1783515 RepID=A0A143C3P5_9ACTN|nr:hypothetical protein [Streptomyces qaidamensis]AMW11635.1 hypothetical protein A4E84_20335 [Streptomyces qaidamensis]